MRTAGENVSNKPSSTVKDLSSDKSTLLKDEIATQRVENNRDAFKALLLSGPTFSKQQLKNIAKTRKDLNQWRTIEH